MSIIQDLHKRYDHFLRIKGEPPEELKCADTDRWELLQNLRSATFAAYWEYKDGALRLFNPNTKIIFT